MAHDIGKVTLLGVRASFLAVFEPDSQKQQDGSTTLRYKGNFLVPKAELRTLQGKIDGVKMPIIEAIQKASQEAKENGKGAWGANEKTWPKLKPDQKFWRDGDLENWDGYEGCWYASANAKVDAKPLLIMNRKGKDGLWLPAQPGQIYSGCYVNATIRIWAQDNEYGKRLNAELKAIQFVKDGESFGGNRPVNPNEEFDDDDVSDAGELGDDEGGDDDDLV